LKKIILFFILSTYVCIAKIGTPTAKSVLDEMLAAIKNLNTISYKLHTKERVANKYLSINSEIKINTKPRKIYLKNPSKKLEVLYCEGENNNEALVNPGKFPFITLKFNPNHNLMRNNKHHSIHDLGFQFIAQMIEESIPANPKLFDKTFLYMGIIEWDGKQCYKIYCEFKDFKYVKYTVTTTTENVISIAKKFNCGDYRIIANNDGLSYTNYITKGTVLKVPNMYAAKTIIYIDVESKIPVNIKLYDDEGIFEVYEFTDIKINRGFAKNEFTKDFAGYGFK